MNAPLLVGLAAPLREVHTAGWGLALPVLLVLGTVWVFGSMVRRDALRDKRRGMRLRNRHRR